MRLERRQALWLPILLLHALLLLAHLPRPPAAATRSERSVVVQLLPAPRAPTIAPPPTSPRVTLPARPRGPATPSMRAPVEASLPPAPVDAPPTEPPKAAEPDSPGTGHVPLLQTDATRHAIRLATRAPLLSERAASATDAPARETAQQRFGREVARTAYGNCLKGEFPGAGAGLLSLPMFLVAEASGRCQK